MVTGEDAVADSERVFIIVIKSVFGSTRLLLINEFCKDLVFDPGIGYGQPVFNQPFL